MTLSKQDLSKLEIECANNWFKDSQLEYFRKVYRSSRDIVSNFASSMHGGFTDNKKIHRRHCGFLWYELYESVNL